MTDTTREAVEALCERLEEAERAWSTFPLDEGDFAKAAATLRALLDERARESLTVFLKRKQRHSFVIFGPPSHRSHEASLEHLEEEIGEARDNPADLTEWADCALLVFDAALRAGHSPASIANAIRDKQTRNEARQWPDWREGDASKGVRHIKEAAGND